MILDGPVSLHSCCSSVILGHGVVTPGREVGDFLLCGFFNGPTPGLEVCTQVQPQRLGEHLSVQVHLPFVIMGEVAHCMVGGKYLLQGIPSESLLELHDGGGKRQ